MTTARTSRPRAPRAVAAATVAALALGLAPALAGAPATASVPRAASTSLAVATPDPAVGQEALRARGAREAGHRTRGWARLTTYRRAVLEGCRPPRDHGFRRIVLRLRNAHDTRLRRAEVSFTDRAYRQPWSGNARTPWVRAGRAAPLARVSTSGRLVTQRLRVRLRTTHDASPPRSLRWTEVPACRRQRRH